MLRKVASSIILPAKTEPTWTLSEPVKKTSRLQKGGDAGLLSRTSHHEQDLHQTQNWFRAFQNSSSRHSVSNCGGTARKKKLSKVASSIIPPAKTEPIWTLSERVIMTLCLQMGSGGGCAPPNPRAFFLSRAGLFSRTSHHEQDLHQTQKWFRAFQNSS